MRPWALRAACFGAGGAARQPGQGQIISSAAGPRGDGGCHLAALRIPGTQRRAGYSARIAVGRPDLARHDLTGRYEDTPGSNFFWNLQSPSPVGFQPPGRADAIVRVPTLASPACSIRSSLGEVSAATRVVPCCKPHRSG
jgi:hypothetical protein